MKKPFIIILTLLSIGMLSVGYLWYTGVWQIGGVRSVVYTFGVNVKYACIYLSDVMDSYISGKGGVRPKGPVGIDVSYYQGKIDWAEVAKDSVKFAYLKATEGTTIVDPSFRRNVHEAQQAGIPIGAYHFFRMTSGAREQYNKFRSVVKRHNLDLIPMLDVECRNGYSIKATQDSVAVFVQLVKRDFKVAPLIYTYENFYNESCAPTYNNYHLYLAKYSFAEPKIKDGKGSYTIWQYTDRGRINGIKHNVDLCKFNPKYTVEHLRLK